MEMNLAEVKELAAYTFAGRLFNMPTKEATFSLMMLCQGEGLHPMQAMRRYHIINGRPSMRADAMQAEFQNKGGKIQWLERSAKKCAAKFSHPQGGELVVEWTIEQAQAAGLTKNPTWQKFPRQMLSARVISEGVRAVFPAVVCGLYTPEEVEDLKIEGLPNEPKKQDKVEQVEIEEAEIVGNEQPVCDKGEIKEAEIVGNDKKTITGAEIAQLVKQVRSYAIKSGCKTQEQLKKWLKALINKETTKLTDLSADELQRIIKMMKEG